MGHESKLHREVSPGLVVLGLLCLVLGSLGIVAVLMWGYSKVLLLLGGLILVGIVTLMKPWRYVCKSCNQRLSKMVRVPFGTHDRSAVYAAARSGTEGELRQLFAKGSLPDPRPENFVLLFVQCCPGCERIARCGASEMKHFEGNTLPSDDHHLTVEDGAVIAGPIVAEALEASGVRWALTREHAGFGDR